MGIQTRVAKLFAASITLCALLGARASIPELGIASASGAGGSDFQAQDSLPRGSGQGADAGQPRLSWIAESMAQSLWLRLLPWATAGSGAPVHHTIGDLWRAPTRDLELDAPILSDGQFVWGPNADGFESAAYLAERESPLQPYASDIDLWASYTSVNPMVLLAVLEIQQGWVSSLPSEMSEDSVRGTIESTAMQLATRFYEHLYLWGARRPPEDPQPSGDPVLLFSDGSAGTLDRSLPSGTYAVLSVLGQSSASWQFDAMLAPSASAQGFPAVFGTLFPTVDPLDESNSITPLAAPPDDLLQLPFPLGATWNASGPHSWNGGSYPPPFSSLDFFTGGSTCSDPANVFTVAAAYGSAKRPDDYRCWLELNHGDGWVTSYYHLQHLYSGAPLTRNGKVGTIACEVCAGGFATGPHVHFSLKYNGAYVSLEGVKLSGWTVHVGDVAYDSGSYERDGVFLNPYSQITNDYQSYYGEGQRSLRFFGNGTGDIDRVKVKMYDLSIGPPADIGDGDFTIEWWMKALPGENAAETVPCGASNSWRLGNILLDRDRGQQDRDYGVSLIGGRITFGVGGDGTGELTVCGASDVRDGIWHHIAVQRRRSDGWMWIFVDGVLEAQGDGPDGDITYPNGAVPLDVCDGPCSNDPFLVIGAEKHGVDPALRSFSGWMDDLRISRVLRYDADFTPPLQPFRTDANTLVLFSFDDSPGTSAFDTSGYPAGPSNGALKIGGSPEGPLWSTDSPFVTGTPTPTGTPEPTATPTETPAPTMTASPTQTQTPAPSPTPTLAPSATFTPSPSPTATSSPVPSASPSLVPTESATPIPSATSAIPAPADINEDGRVDVLDAQLCVNVFLGTEGEPAIVARADVNGDGAVNVIDVQIIVNTYLGS